MEKEINVRSKRKDCKSMLENRRKDAQRSATRDRTCSESVEEWQLIAQSASRGETTGWEVSL